MHRTLLSFSDKKDGRADAKAQLLALPEAQHVLFSCASMACGVVCFANGTGLSPFKAAALASLPAFGTPLLSRRRAAASRRATGPIVIAIVLTLRPSDVAADPAAALRALLKPNDNDGFFGSLLHVGVGTAFTALPIAWACYLALK